MDGLRFGARGIQAPGGTSGAHRAWGSRGGVGTDGPAPALGAPFCVMVCGRSGEEEVAAVVAGLEEVGVGGVGDVERNAVAGAGGGVGGDARGEDGSGRGGADEVDGVAAVLDGGDGDGDAGTGGISGAGAEGVRADAEGGGPADVSGRGGGEALGNGDDGARISAGGICDEDEVRGISPPIPPTAAAVHRAAAFDAARDEVHRGRADEGGDESVGGGAVEVQGRADLLEGAGVHDGDDVAEGHRLLLVMGDVEGGGAEAGEEGFQFGAGGEAEAGVEAGEGFIEEEGGGLADDGAAEGDALALAAGEVGRAAVEEVGEAEHGRGGMNAALDLGAGDAAHPQGEGHVVEDREMGVEGVRLEDHGDVAVARGEGVDGAAGDEDLAGGRGLEAGDHAEGGGLAAAGGAEEGEEGAVGDAEGEVADGGGVRGRARVDLVEVVEGDLRHGPVDSRSCRVGAGRIVHESRYGVPRGARAERRAGRPRP